MTRVVCISDTHLQHDFDIPEGDILVHAGDLTFDGSLQEVTKALVWLKGVRVGLGFSDVVVIPGNHDWMAERDPELIKRLMAEAGVTYLQHESALVQGLKFFGSGYTPRFYDWALNVDRGPELAKLWAQIPDDTAVLVTHGPPMGHLDTVNRPAGQWDAMDFGSFGRGDKSRAHLPTRVGCADLAARIVGLTKLRAHIFGHIHRPGLETSVTGVTYVNASICNERYKAAHKPTVIDL